MDAKKNIKTNRTGFTLIELTVSAVIAVIVMLGLAVVFVSSHRAYEVIYNKVNADVITDGYYARSLFDAVVRKSAGESTTVDENGQWAELRYYQDDDSTYLDRYARFYTTDKELKVEYGTVDGTGTKETKDTTTVCANVFDCVFRCYGNSVVMVLTLDDGNKSNTIVSSAYLHN